MAAKSKTGADAKKTQRRLERRVLRYVASRRLIERGQTVLIGASGGADSTALLLLLSRLAPRLDIAVRAAYFDHELRGKKASAAERQAVEALARSACAPLITASGDVRGHARKRRLGIEEAARELRYAFLAEAAREAGARVVAVGHTADDQVETILMHILRGSGLSGLAGMLPRSPWPVSALGGDDLTLVRPLLETRRAETEAYCRESGIEPLADVSNRSPRYRRNVVRNDLLPLLREYVPGVDASLLRLARAAASERQAQDETAARLLDDAATGEAGRIRLSIASLRQAPPDLLPLTMRLAASRLLHDTRDLSERHLLAMARAIGKPAGTSLDLPRGLKLRVDYGEVMLSLADRGAEPLPIEGVDLTLPGETRAGGWRLEASLVVGVATLPESPWEATVDADTLVGKLSVRRRRPGDRFQPLGIRGTKKLQDFFVDLKIPRAARSGVPLVCVGEAIAWVVGHRIAEPFRYRGERRACIAEYRMVARE